MAKKDVIIILIIILIAIIASYLTFFRPKACSDIDCFNSAMVDCKKVSYTDESKEAFWKYVIKGRKKDDCEVEVKLLQLKEGTVDLIDLENKEMICELPLGTVGNPKNYLNRCHGLLKEEMQEVIIKNLHKYIVENLGELREGLDQVIE